MKAHLRPLRCDHETLEGVLHHESRQGDHGEAPVEYAVFQHRPVCSEQERDRPHEDKPDNGQDGPADDRRIDHEGKVPVRFRVIPLAHSLGDDGASAGPDHQSEGADDHHGRPDDVQGCKRRRSDEVGDEDSVHDTVDAPDEHHEDARNGGNGQAPVSVMSAE